MEKVEFNNHADPVTVLKAVLATTASSNSNYADGYRDGLRFAISILIISDSAEQKSL